MTSLVAKNIRKIADDKGLKYKVVAVRAGFDPKAFSAMLTGRKTIHPDFIPAIATALSVTPNEIYGIGEVNLDSA